MQSDIIIEIININKEIRSLRKDSFLFGIEESGYIAAQKDSGAVYTASAIRELAPYKTGFIIFNPPQIESEGLDFIYILVKKNNSFIYEFFGEKANLPISVLKSVFEDLFRDKRELVVLTNFEPIKSDYHFSLGDFLLPLNASFHVVDLHLSEVIPLKSFKTKSKYFYFWFVGLLVFFVIAVSAFVTTNEKQPVVVTPIVKKKVERYLSLKNFYTKNSVEAYSEIVSLYRQANRASLINGWNLTGAFLTRDENTGSLIEILELNSTYGEMKSLQSFISENGYIVDIQNNKAILSRIKSKNPVFTNYARFHVGSYQKALTSGLNFYFDSVETKTRDLKVKAAEKNVVFKENTINIPNQYLEDLVSIAGFIRGMPYSLEEIKFMKSHNESSFSLSIKLVIAGVTDGS